MKQEYIDFIYENLEEDAIRFKIEIEGETGWIESFEAKDMKRLKPE